MTKSGIYKITNKVNGKFYIGSSNNINKRWIHHRCMLRNKKHPNGHLQSSWNKHGEENFVFSVLLETKEELLLEKEQELLDTLQPFKDNGYNIAKVAFAPMLGMTHTEETKKRLSEIFKGRIISAETRRRMSEARKGKTLSKEHKVKISQTMKGHKHSAETKSKISKAHRGEKSHQAKLTEEQVIAIKKELFSEDRKRTQKAIAKEYGVAPATISRIKTGIRWGRT